MAQPADPEPTGRTAMAIIDAFPTHNIGKPQLEPMPEEPRQHWRLIGPGIVAAGVGLASGEFILYPYIASQVGLVFVWVAFVGLITQFFINMEIERYTLAPARRRSLDSVAIGGTGDFSSRSSPTSQTSGQAGRPARRP